MASDAMDRTEQSDAVERADRVLVWLWLLTFIVGGVATTAVVFGADIVLTRASQRTDPAHTDDHPAAEPATHGDGHR